MLNYASVKIATEEESINYYGTKVIISSTICSLAGEGNAAICHVSCKSTIYIRWTIIISNLLQGDSGSGLVIREPDGKYTLNGIASFVSGAGCHLVLNCFVNVAHFRDYIEDMTGIYFREYSSWDN